MMYSFAMISVRSDDLRRRRRRIDIVDQAAAMLEHRALIDGALVGDFATIDRQRRIEQDRTGNPRRGAGRGREERGEALPKRVADQRISRGRGEVILRQGRIDQAAAVEIEHDKRYDLVTVDPDDHRIAHQWCAGGDEAGTQRTDADPGSTGQLEVFADAAIEIEAGIEIP